VIQHAMQNLESELRAAGKERLLGHLRPHLQGDRNGRPYAEIAADLGMSEGAVKVTVHRLRLRYGELLRTEVAGRSATRLTSPMNSATSSRSYPPDVRAP